MPVWIQLPDLPPRLCTTDGQSGITSFVGRPLAIDQMTNRRVRMDYARVLVEIDQKAEHPVEIPIILPGGVIVKQKIVYEWQVQRCGACGLVEHEAGQCRRRRRQQAPPTSPEQHQDPPAPEQQQPPSNPPVNATQQDASGVVNAQLNTTTPASQNVVPERTVEAPSVQKRGKGAVNHSNKPPQQWQGKRGKGQGNYVDLSKGGHQNATITTHVGTVQGGSTSLGNSFCLPPNG